ncbi:MAG: DUF4339 domain-containing protein, partial [Verrucomicrobiae bacterium]|nr:DUF4339 domain-containing protein [Verrucomicrobiae bacterium]
EEARARAAAEARAEEEARARAAAEAKAAREQELRAAAEAKAAEEARARAEAEAKAEEKARVRAAEEAARHAAEVAKAAEDARAAAEAELRALEEARAADIARAKAEAEAKAAERAAAKFRETEKRAKSGKESARSKVWHYTCEGERLGPIGFSQLRKMAVEGSLDPRLDMVWKQGTDLWKPAGQIHGLFERNGESAAPDTPTSPDPGFLPPPSGAVKAKALSHHRDWPGARRRIYLPVVLGFPFVWSALISAASPFLMRK